MKFKLTTYKTLTGNVEILETVKKKNTEAIIYKNNQPAYFVDCFDLQTEANVLMNSLVLCQKRSMNVVINDISKKNDVNLTIKKTPLFAVKSTSIIKELDLPPLPEEWLN